MSTISTANTEKSQVNYWQVVNFDRDTNEITVLDYVFKHSDGFKGATGSVFTPISKAEYDDQTDEDNVIEYLIDSGFEIPETHKRGGFEGMVKQMDASEIESLMFDTSYREHWDTIREQCGLNEDTAFVFNCIGGGRCFDANFKGNVNPKLSKIIREYETKLK